MSEFRNVSTQAELEKALAAGDIPVIVSDNTFVIESGGPLIQTWESSQPRVEARESSQPRVEALESSQPRVEARDSSQPRVEAWGSSQPRVVARDSSQPRVVARDSSQPRVVARDSSQPRVEARESSQPRVVAWESSQPRVVARDSSQPRVVAWESSQPRVEAWGSSQPRVEARESSQPRVVAWDSSQPRVVARDSSQPRVVAWGSSQPRVEARDSSQVTGSAGKHTLAGYECHGAATVDLPGAVLLRTPDEIDGIDDWIDYYALASEDEKTITVYKLVSDELRSRHGMLYEIGSTVTCDDWSTEATCRGGLHFSPTPTAAHRYADGTRYLACEVKRKGVVLLGDKIKAESCRVLFEIDEDGEPVVLAEAS